MTKNVTTTNTDLFHTSLDDYTTSIYTIDSNDTILVSGATGTSYNWTAGANGTSAIDWGNISVTGTISSNPMTVTQSGTIDLTGDNADIRVNGRSLMDAIDALEQRLNILVPNPELEKEWDELRELGERYRELEKKCKEKGEMWKKLKSMLPPTVE